MNNGLLRQVLLFVLAAILVGVIFALIVIVLSVPARAHSETDQRMWRQQWVERVRASGGLSQELLAEHLDFEARHAPSPPVVQASSSQLSPSGGNSGMGSGVEQWRSLASGYGWDVDTALCLMAKESGGDPNAYNPSGASGLMQVLSSWADNFGVTSADLFVPRINLDIAYALYADGGWSHWSPYLRGECR